MTTAILQARPGSVQSYSGHVLTYSLEYLFPPAYVTGGTPIDGLERASIRRLMFPFWRGHVFEVVYTNPMKVKAYRSSGSGVVLGEVAAGTDLRTELGAIRVVAFLATPQ